MSNFVTLACPSCGSKLQITNDIERFACGYCGSEHLVRRSGGIISLTPSLAKIQAGVDKTASELAIKRLKEEIPEIERNIFRIRDKLVKDSVTSNDLGGEIEKFIINVYHPDYHNKTGLQKLLFMPNYSIVQNISSDELIRMLDYFMGDPNKHHPKYQSQRDAFVQIRERLKPIRSLKEQLDKKRIELQNHQRIVSE